MLRFAIVKESDEFYHKSIGDKIKELRIAAGFTSYENFALEYELSARYYWEVENGKNLTLTYLFNLLRIHELSLEDFFKGLH